MVELERVEPPEEVRQAPGLTAQDRVLHLSRIIPVIGAPLVSSRSSPNLPEDFRPDIPERERTSTVFELIDREPVIRVARGAQNICASGATEEDSEALAIPVGAPVLITVTVMVAPGSWRRAVHRGDEFKQAVALIRS